MKKLFNNDTMTIVMWIVAALILRALISYNIITPVFFQFVLEGVKALAWPLVVIWLFRTFEPEIRSRIGR